MKFIKVLTPRYTSTDFGYALITNKNIKVKIATNNMQITQIGIIEGGIGCVLEKRKEPTVAKYAVTTRNYDEKDIPTNLQATGYKFRIPATKISDTEYAFMFEDAKTV